MNDLLSPEDIKLQKLYDTLVAANVRGNINIAKIFLGASREELDELRQDFVKLQTRMEDELKTLYSKLTELSSDADKKKISDEIKLKQEIRKAVKDYLDAHPRVTSPNSRKRSNLIIVALIAALIIIALAIVLPLTLGGRNSSKHSTPDDSVQQFNIEYILNGGVADNPDTYLSTEDDFVLKNPTRAGYTFDGWSGTGLNEISTEVTVSKGSTGNRTYTANWTPIEYTVTYNLDGGVNGANPNKYTVETDEITLVNPSKIGYDFAGWYADETLTQKITAIQKGSVGNIVLYARFDLQFEIYETDTIAILKYVGGDIEVIIPQTINRKNVTAIGDSAFDGCTDLTSITIPNSVTNIGDNVFRNCTSLTSITIPNSVTDIGDNVFRNCTSFTSITIPNSVTDIGAGAFSGCLGLMSITIPDSVTEIGDGAFEGCVAIESATMPANAIECVPKSNLKTITITSGDIVDGAFWGCAKLTSAIVEENVMSIGIGAFSGCSSLTSITLPFVGNRAGVTSSDTYQYPLGYIFGTGSYTGGTEVIQQYYGSNISSIICDRYYIPASLRRVTITGGNILCGAFHDCSMLTSITIPDGVTSIGDWAFSDCSMLTSITIPNGVTNIGDYAFSYCYKLVEVYNLSSLNITKGSSDYGCVAKYAFHVYTSANVPSKFDITAEGYIFYKDVDNMYLMGFTGEESILTLPNKHNGQYYKINTYAFYECDELTGIKIPSGVTSIGNHAFDSCIGLTSVMMGSDVTDIGDSAFEGCTGLTSIKIPNSVTNIGDYAFYNCTELTSITMGSGVTNIGSSAFPDSIKIVYYDGDIAAWCQIRGLGGLLYHYVTVETPHSSTGTSTMEVRYKTHCVEQLYINGQRITDNLIIPQGVKSIGDKAFYSCYGITSLELPDSLTSIGDEVFSYCSALKEIIFSGTKAQWEKIEKGNKWDLEIGRYTIHCSDGSFSQESSTSPSSNLPVIPAKPF